MSLEIPETPMKKTPLMTQIAEASLAFNTRAGQLHGRPLTKELRSSFIIIQSLSIPVPPLSFVVLKPWQIIIFISYNKTEIRWSTNIGNEKENFLD